jgi:hypothetical protein
LFGGGIEGPTASDYGEQPLPFKPSVTRDFPRAGTTGAAKLHFFANLLRFLLTMPDQSLTVTLQKQGLMEDTYVRSNF